jgi:secreted PhoX family phosphatase
VFCEDATAVQHVRAVSKDGEVFDIARNLRNSIEFAGACFSPDGETLFVNRTRRLKDGRPNGSRPSSSQQR